MDSPHTFFSQLNALRDVPRFSTYPFTRRESVAEHSFYVALIVRYLCWKIEGVDAGKALSFALMHDAEESMLGDVLYNTKRSLTGYQELAESTMLNFLKSSIPEELVGRAYGSWKWSRYDGTLEGQVVDIADSLAVLVFLIHECSIRGNNLTIRVREDIHERLKKYDARIKPVVEFVLRGL